MAHQWRWCNCYWVLRVTKYNNHNYSQKTNLCLVKGMVWHFGKSTRHHSIVFFHPSVHDPNFSPHLLIPLSFHPQPFISQLSFSHLDPHSSSLLQDPSLLHHLSSPSSIIYKKWFQIDIFIGVVFVSEWFRREDLYHSHIGRFNISLVSPTDS